MKSSIAGLTGSPKESRSTGADKKQVSDTKGNRKSMSSVVNANMFFYSCGIGLPILIAQRGNHAKMISL